MIMHADIILNIESWRQVPSSSRIGVDGERNFFLFELICKTAHLTVSGGIL